MGLESLKETDEGTEEFDAAVAAGVEAIRAALAHEPWTYEHAIREGIKAAIVAAQDREAEMQRAGEEAVEEFLAVIHAKAEQIVGTCPPISKVGYGALIDSAVHMVLAELDGGGHGQYSLIMRHEKSGRDVDLTRYGCLHEQMKRVAS